MTPEQAREMADALTDRIIAARWRVGRQVGRTIYAECGAEPGVDDVLIGLMDSRVLAAVAVEAHNAVLAHPEDKP